MSDDLLKIVCKLINLNFHTRAFSSRAPLMTPSAHHTECCVGAFRPLTIHHASTIIYCTIARIKLTVLLRGVASLNSMNHNVDWVTSGSHANTSTNTTTANASQYQFQQWNQSQYQSTMCTHAVNTAAHLPDYVKESSKRQREDPASFFLVSQDEESSASSSCTGMEMEMDFQSDETYPAGNHHHHHHQKRQRFCREVEGGKPYDNLSSQGSVSVTTTSTNHAATPKSNPFSLSTKKPPQPKPPVVEWWKQKRQNRNKQNVSSSISACCFICQKAPNPRTPLPQASIRRRAPATMPPNALLAYLTPLQSASSSSGRGRTRSPSLTFATPASNTATTPTHPDQTPCTFCERAVCSDCLGQCQDCQQVYCSLCRTTDYNSCNTSRLERTLCLDCAAVCNETGDSMHLD
jgi:hypothetical protein